MKTNILVLAAGKGERMHSRMHKVLQPLCGKALIDHVLDAVRPLSENKPLVAVRFEKEQILSHLGDKVRYIHQDPNAGRGTLISVKAAEDVLPESAYTLIAFGDMPLISTESYRAVLEAVKNGADCAFLTTAMNPAPEHGRIIRNAQGTIIGVCENKDCTAQQSAIDEIHASVYCFKTDKLLEALRKVPCENANGADYLTDIIAQFTIHGFSIKGITVQNPQDCRSVNDMADLAKAEAILRTRINLMHMQNGVRLIDPERTYIDCDVQIAADTVIYPGCCLQGKTVIEENVILLPNSRLVDAHICTGAQVESSVILQGVVGEGTTVGPNAYIRPGSKIGAHCRIGDFVEIKNAVIGDGTKVSHLTYVGDADLGKNINLGCGVVFVNYDGKNKYRSTVGDHAFIGCNCNLVAPVHIGADAYIAAGSTVTEDIESGALCIARSRQSVKPGWVAKRREKGLLK